MISAQRNPLEIPRRAFSLALLGALVCCAGCEQSRTPPVIPPAKSARVADGGPPAIASPASPDSHAQMLEMLQAIVEETPDKNEWLGDRLPRELRAWFKDVPKTADKNQLFRMHHTLGVEEARLGNEAAALRNFQQAYELLEDLGDRLPAHLVYETIFRVGVAHLRRGETENCCRRNTPQSCILPIRGGGLHTNTDGSRQAIRYFTEVLKTAPRESRAYLKAQWLLNIAYMTVGGYPEDVPEPYRIAPATFDSAEPFPHFQNIAPQLGLNTFNLCGGAIADDFDNDGYLDIVTSTSDTAGQLRYFRNNHDGTFEDRTEQAGLSGIVGGLNCVQADYNNDGNVDVLVLRGAWYGQAGRHPNSLLRNNGDGSFTDVTIAAGLAKKNYPTQTGAWADYDNDGDLDLFVGNEHAPPLHAPCQLFRNNGDETFTDVARKAGVENRRFAKGVVWADYDGDRLADFYVSNLGAPNRLYRNQGDSTFRDVAVKAGVDRPLESFPVWFWDFDNDGALDLYVPSYMGGDDAVADVAASYLGMQQRIAAPRLYRGDGKGGFVDVAESCNLTRIHLPMGANFGDLDNDGFLDFYLGTGYPSYEALMPNVMYRNLAGKRFVDITSAGGFGHLQKGHGIAFADFDHDGDQDVFAQMGGNFPGDKFSNALFENPGNDSHWIAIQLVGVKSNRSAIGAQIRVDVVENEKLRTVHRRVNSGGSFGANPLRQSIGLGSAMLIKRLTIYWPTSDRTQTFESVAADQFLRITEDRDAVEPVALPQIRFHGATEPR